MHNKILTSVWSVTPSKAKCSVCGKKRICGAHDAEMGWICQECLDSVLRADQMLNATEGIDRICQED